jgi:type VI secretion system protein ImpB
MARASFQNEIPESRINIKMKNPGGSWHDVELSHRVLVMGDFTLKEDDTPLEELEKVPLDKSENNIETVMNKLKPSLQFPVRDRLSDDEDAEMMVDLEFRRMKDFRPESVVEQTPALHSLLLVRGLLKELKARVISNKQFRKELERILLDSALTADLKEELNRIAPQS